jgi:hypothetical protein
VRSLKSSWHITAKRQSRTGTEYRRTLQSHIGSKRIADIQRADVVRLHGSLAGAPNEANRCVAVVPSVWNWAARRDETGNAASPSQASRYPEKSRERYLTPAELGRLGDALADF